MLAPGVVLVADGGSLVPAARRPIEGMERVASVLSHFSRVAPGAEMATLLLNGAVAARIEMDGEFSAAVAFVVEDGRIASIYVVVNPRKLSRLGEEVRLSRA